MVHVYKNNYVNIMKKMYYIYYICYMYIVIVEVMVSMVGITVDMIYTVSSNRWISGKNVLLRTRVVTHPRTSGTDLFWLSGMFCY